MNAELFRSELQFANDPFSERLFRTFLTSPENQDISLLTNILEADVGSLIGIYNT